MLKHALLACAIAMASMEAAYPQTAAAGVYLCTVVEKAGIAGRHSELAGPPFAQLNKGAPTRFKIQISRMPKSAKRYRLTEIPYVGSDRDQAEWEDENSVLHGLYLGDGSAFNAENGPAFLTLAQTHFPNSDGDLEFYHAGFEYAGGEDQHLSVRWGRCRKAK